MRSVLILLAACAPDTAPLGEKAPPPYLELNVPAELPSGETFDMVVDGTIAQGEVATLFASLRGPGPGPCLAWAGGACLGILGSIRLGTATVDASGQAILEVFVPETLADGTRIVFQAVLARGRRGSASLLSNVEEGVVTAGVPGCTDPAASNYDPTATIDDGSCFGCAGSEGDFAPTANGTLSGAHVYDSFTIPQGVTITGGAQALDITVCGPVQIDGILDVSGGPGVDGTATAGNPNGAVGGSGGAGVAGGFAGGRGGNSQSGSGSSGSGPSPGRGGGSLLNVQPHGTYYDGGNGGGGGYGSAGTRGFQAAFTGTAGSGGSSTGDPTLAAFPAVGGSGGGGGSGGLGGASTGFGGSGGGAGGGVVRILADDTLAIGPSGAIRANGGRGGGCQNTGARGGGGSGSGGAIWLGTPELIHVGVIEAIGPANCFLNGGGVNDGRGGVGRIRVDLPAGSSPSGVFDPAPGYIGTWAP